MPKRKTSFNPEWMKEHEFIAKSRKDEYHAFCRTCHCDVEVGSKGKGAIERHAGTDKHKLNTQTAAGLGNFPDSCRLDGCLVSDSTNTDVLTDQTIWKTILPPQKLRAHTQHLYERELGAVGPVSHVRLVMAPDGGVSRLRILGTIYSKL